MLNSVQQDSIFTSLESIIEKTNLENTLDTTTSTQIQNQLKKYQTFKTKTDTLKNGDSGFSINFLRESTNINWDKVNNVWTKDPNVTADMLLDSIQIENPNFMHRLMAKQLLKYSKKHNIGDIINEVIDNIPIMMIFLLPIFALLLKLLYIRQKRFYIEHLIFALHIHTLLFFLGIIVLLAGHWFSIALESIAFIYMSIYAYLMFRRVYNQHWFKVLAKMFILGMFYSLIITIASGFEVLISLLIF